MTAASSQPPPVADGDGPAVAEIVTNAEGVHALLAANGGRMRQAAIADDLDWSASNTVLVTDELVDEGTLEKHQLGNKIVIDLVDDAVRPVSTAHRSGQLRLCHRPVSHADNR